MKYRLLFALLLFPFLRLYATHIVGGEITYRCLGDSTYEVTLSVYRDCYNGQPPFDSIGNVGVYDSTTWELIQWLRPRFIEGKDDTLPIILANPCLVAPPDVCVHRYVYRDTVILPFKKGGYTLVYQRCCRNTLIRNLISPLDVGASYTAHIGEETLLRCNSSALFKSWPPVAICIHQPVNFDHGAIDADGDSLVYRLCTPLTGATPGLPLPQPPNPGPYVEVPWQDPPYNLTNVLGGDPLKLDPKTGWMTGVPNTIGNFVVGVCVDEYRDDSLLNTSRRDFQFNVSDCGQPVAAFFAPKILCDTRAVKFVNGSSGTGLGKYLWYFDWENNKSLISNLVSPFYTYKDTGYYTVALIINPGQPCNDTAFQIIHITETIADAALDIQYPSCDSTSLVVKAVDLSKDPVFGITGWKWELKGPKGYEETITKKEAEFKVFKPGNYTLTLIVTSGNGCMDTLAKQFSAPFPPLSAVPLKLSICRGDTVALLPEADLGYLYEWTPAVAISNPKDPNPLAYPDSTTVYTVKVSGNGPCVRTQTVTVEVVNLGTLMATATPDTIYRGETSQLDVPGVTFQVRWEPASSLSNALIVNPIAKPDETTDYEVRRIINGNCLITGTVRVVVLDPICREPYLFFPTGFSPNGDGENDALKLEGAFIEEAYWVVYNRWGEKVFEANSADDVWDGRFHGTPQPAETYGYYLRVRCIGGELWEKKGNVTLLR